MKHRQPSGFSLVELLVVITIIVVLAAILFPVFSAAKSAAKGTAAISNISQMGKAVVLYSLDADGLYPLAAYATSESFVLWHDILDPYVKNKDVWHCPGSTVSKVDSSGTVSSHWGYNFQYLTDLASDFANANGHTAVAESAVGDVAGTVVFTAAKSSVLNSWCGDDGKFLLAPSGQSGDCLGRPDPVVLETVPIVWADTHAGRLKPARFYTGQLPVDRWFDLNE